jgi:hypothetical protein
MSDSPVAAELAQPQVQTDVLTQYHKHMQFLHLAR